MTIKDEYIQYLKDADKVLKEHNLVQEIVVVGAGGFVLTDLYDRQTHDIDSLVEVSEEIHLLLLENPGIDINSSVLKQGKNSFAGSNTNFDIEDGFESSFPEWEKHLIEIKELKDCTNLIANTLEKELLIASKFFTKEEDQDLVQAALREPDLDKDLVESFVVKSLTGKYKNVKRSQLTIRSMAIKNFYGEMGWAHDNSEIWSILDKRI